MLDNGDCTVIKTPTGKNIIIDTGEQDNTISKYLLDRGIMKVDYMIISHFDSDHCGKVTEIIEKIKVKNIIISKQIEPSEELNNIMKIINKNKINIILVKAGDKLQIDKDVYFQVLWPNENEMIKENGLNNNSIVTKLNYKNFSILFTGDIEKMAEKKIVREYDEELKSTILKVAHHGSRTSSTEEILEKINCKIAIIGVGKDNKFDHPNSEVIERLKTYGSIIYRTDLHGEITIKVDKTGKIKINTNIK